MEVSSSQVPQTSVQQWLKWRMHALEAAPLPFAGMIMLFVVAGGVWAGLSTYLKQIATGTWNMEDFRQSVVAVFVCTAVLLYLRTLKKASVLALSQLRPVVPIPDEAYQRLAQQMLLPQGWAELFLLACSIALFVLFFIVQPGELGILPRSTLLDWLALFYLSAYAILAIWIILTLVYCGIRSSLALRNLSRSPLIVNAFDPAMLLPFGRLGALHSLGFVGMVLIPMALLGPPRSGGYGVLLLSLASLGVLFVPLWGVHRQIVHARERVLDAIAADLMGVQTKLLSDAGRNPEEAKLLYEQAQRLTTLRSSVLSGPSWPFRDNGVLARLVTALFLPTMVAVISYAMQRFVFPLISRTP